DEKVTDAHRGLGRHGKWDMDFVHTDSSGSGRRDVYRPHDMADSHGSALLHTGSRFRPRPRRDSSMTTIGIDIGGTKIAAGVVDESGRVLQQTRRATDALDPEAIESAVIAAVAELRVGHD